MYFFWCLNMTSCTFNFQLCSQCLQTKEYHSQCHHDPLLDRTTRRSLTWWRMNMKVVKRRMGVSLIAYCPRRLWCCQGRVMMVILMVMTPRTSRLRLMPPSLNPHRIWESSTGKSFMRLRPGFARPTPRWKVPKSSSWPEQSVLTALTFIWGFNGHCHMVGHSILFIRIVSERIKIWYIKILCFMACMLRLVLLIWTMFPQINYDISWLVPFQILLRWNEHPERLNIIKNMSKNDLSKRRLMPDASKKTRVKKTQS